MKGSTLSACILVLVLLAIGEVRGLVSHMVLGPVAEQQKKGTIVGNVAKASMIAKDMSPSEFQQLRYKIFNLHNQPEASLFALNSQTGTVFTNARIDREAVCENQDECLITFKVRIESYFSGTVHVVSVSVNITDVNDNAPTFPREEMTLYIPEGSTGMSYPLPTAVDPDTKRNSVADYDLLTNTSTFGLNIAKTREDNFKISLSVNNLLDREIRDQYLVYVTARDGGHWPLTGTLTVHISVTDINDNAPQFIKNIYMYQVKDNAPVGTVIGNVHAVDMDTGINALIIYSFRSPSARSKLQELFAINPSTGEIKLIAPLQVASGNTLEAIIMAKDNGVPRLMTQAILVINIENTGIHRPRIEFVPQNQLYDNTVLIMENVRTPKLVGTMKVEPRFSNTVECNTSHNSFRILELEHVSQVFKVLLQKPLDREKEERININISCSDVSTPSMTAMTEFHVIVGDRNDNPPAFSQHLYRANLTENAKEDVEVIYVSAHDADKGINGQFYYYLFPRENEMFRLNSKTGKLSSSMAFDREVLSEVSVVIKAIDEGDQAMTGTTTVVVQILDQNDNAPSLETVEFDVVEGSAPKSYVGQLSARDIDVGINAEVEYCMEAVSPLLPFTLYPDGRIYTSRDAMIDRELQDTYMLEICMMDKGTPRMSSSGTITIHVVDINDNIPQVLFPTAKNNTVTIMWDQSPNTSFTRIHATDPDVGDNAKLSFFFTAGNEKNLFEVSPENGTVFLRRDIDDTDGAFHRLRIVVRDNGKPQELETLALLNIRIDVTNAMFTRNKEPAEINRNILIAGIVGGVTVIICIIIFVVFQMRSSNRVHRRANDSSKRHKDKTGIQEECVKMEIEKEKVVYTISSADYEATPSDLKDV